MLVVTTIATAFHLFDLCHKLVENALEQIFVLDCEKYVVAFFVLADFVNKHFVLFDLVEFLNRLHNDKPSVVDVESREVIKFFVFVCLFVVKSDDIVIFFHIVLVFKKICHCSSPLDAGRLDTLILTYFAQFASKISLSI